MQNSINSKAEKIKLFISDVDGVLTDGKIILGNNGEEFKSFHARDGMGITRALERGLQIALITGRSSEIVKTRALELGIEEVYQGIKDKIAILQKLKNKYQIDYPEIAYIGDDLNDLPVLKLVGFSISVADAVKEVKSSVDYITDKKGGKGAVREALEFIISASDNGNKAGGDMVDWQRG